MGKKELNKILKLHKLYLENDKNGERANLSGVNLSDTDLSEVNLSEANLSGANLSRANLFYTDLSGANLIGANLSNAKLFGATLFGAKMNLKRRDLMENKKVNWGLVDLTLIETLAITLTEGLGKHKEDNWKNVPLKDHKAAFMRHLLDVEKGVDVDKDSGKPPIWHAFTRLYFMVYFDRKRRKDEATPKGVLGH